MSLTTSTSTSMNDNDLGVSYSATAEHLPYPPTNSPVNTPNPHQQYKPPSKQLHHRTARPACVGHESPIPYDLHAPFDMSSQPPLTISPIEAEYVEIDLPPSATIEKVLTPISNRDKRVSFLRRIQNWGKKFRLKTK